MKKFYIIGLSFCFLLLIVATILFISIDEKRLYVSCNDSYEQEIRTFSKTCLEKHSDEDCKLILITKFPDKCYGYRVVDFSWLWKWSE